RHAHDADAAATGRRRDRGNRVVRIHRPDSIAAPRAPLPPDAPTDGSVASVGAAPLRRDWCLAASGSVANVGAAPLRRDWCLLLPAAQSQMWERRLCAAIGVLLPVAQ